ncbi:MAG: hypothetical protein M3M94_00350 [Actinomycetota bacterium]|nr:hypothetical protein [Actinomycetota bacterium]
MADDLPQIPSLPEAELVSFSRWEDDDEIEVRIRLEDRTEIEVRFPLDSPTALDVLHLFAERVPELLRSIGQTGFVLARHAPPEEYDDGDEDDE